jgi:phosphate transport system permease protein
VRTASLIRRRRVDWLAERSLFVLAVFPLALVILIILALGMRAWPLFHDHSLWNLLTGTTWNPQQGEFGFFPFIMGTVWVTVVALLLAVPPCLLTAIYLAEYAQAATRKLAQPLLDLLAAIPSVVHGVWGLLAVVPWVQKSLAPAIDRWLGFIPLFANHNPTGYGIMAGGIVLAVMVAPFIIAITFEVMHSVPAGVREASLAVGATRWQTIRHAVLPHCMAGVMAGVVLAASRALGETMAVMMVVGNVIQTPTSIFDTAYPLTALIANNYGEMMSIPMYDAALLGAALLLLVIVLIFNVLAALALRQVMARFAQ